MICIYVTAHYFKIKCNVFQLTYFHKPDKANQNVINVVRTNFLKKHKIIESELYM